jgi:hypothetical protein
LISRDEALQVAAQEIRQGPVLMDPFFAPWQSAHVGEPVLVSNVWKQPSYWLVPVERNERVIGFVRVLGTGQGSALGAYYRDPHQLDAAPGTVTGIDSAEAARQAAGRIDRTRGEIALPPVYIHDGPPGREAWLVEVVQNSHPVRWLFITPGGIYERPAGSTLDPTLE